MLRVLFIHAASEKQTEYNVHRLLAEHADPEKIDCYFVWQSATHDPSKNIPARLARPDRNFFHDFGRNLSLTPRPSKWRRAGLMLWRLPGSLLYLTRLIWQVRPHVIYTSQQNYDLQLTGLLRRLVRLPRLIHIHYPTGSRFNIDPDSPHLGKSAVRTILKARYLVAVSHYVRQCALDMGLCAENIETIHNLVDVKMFDVPKEPYRHTIRAEFGWPDDTPLVISVGRLDRSKGHLVLVEAFARVRRELPQARLLICGAPTPRTNHHQRLYRKVKELQLEDCVIFAGYREDMASIYAAGDLFCLPTEDEAFGLVFAEAMIAELPVVACRSGAVPEQVVDQQTGLLSEPGNPVKLADNILRILLNPALAREMGRAGKQRALENFAPWVITPQWEKLLYRWFTPGENLAAPEREPQLEPEPEPGQPALENFSKHNQE